MAYEFIDKQWTPVTTKVGNYVFEDKPVEAKPNLSQRIISAWQRLWVPQWQTTFKQDVQSFLAPAVSMLRGLGNVGQWIWDFIGRTTGTMSEEDILAQREFDKKMHKQMLWEAAETKVSKWSQELGKMFWQYMLTAPIYAAAWPTTNALGRIWISWLKWAAATQVANIGWEWKAATLWETALWAGTNMFLQSLWEAKKWLYNKAFKQTKQTLAEKWVSLEWKKPWQLVMEQNLRPNIKKWLEQIKSNMQETRKSVEASADKAWSFAGSNIKDWIKKDMIVKLWFDKLNQSAKSTKDLIKKVWNLVDDYIPKWKMTWGELVQQIKNLNATLPDKLKWMWIENVVSQKWMTQALTKTLKGVLDNLATKWWEKAWVIQSLYQKYSKQALVKQILENENLRKTLGRQLVGAWVWGAIGWYYGVSDFQKWDIGKGLLKIAWWSLLWSQAMKIANNPNVLMKVWNILSKIWWKWVQQAWAVLSSKSEK